MQEERRNELLGIALFAVGVLIAISLISFAEEDLAYFTSSPTRPAQNYAGIIGAYVGMFLFTAFGRAAFVVPALIIIWGVKKFTTGGVQKFYRGERPNPTVEFLDKILTALRQMQLDSAA